MGTGEQSDHTTVPWWHWRFHRWTRWAAIKDAASGEARQARTCTVCGLVQARKVVAWTLG